MSEKEEKEEKLVKNMECIDCKRIFKCNGKPRNVERCVNFEQRRKQ